MRLRTVLFAILFALAISAVHAQSADPDKKASETPPDTKAYQEASHLNDPAEKIVALQNFKKDFPDSPFVENANMAILSTLAARMPEQTARIQQFAKTIVNGAKDKKEKGSLSAEVADTLLTNKVLLTDAERYAKASVDAMNQSQFIADQKAQSAKRESTAKTEKDRPKPPTDEELVKRFNQSRARRLAALGRIEFELGKTPAALKILTEAYAADHDQPVAEGTLGEIALQKGDTAQALEYLVSARVAGQSGAFYRRGALFGLQQDTQRDNRRSR